MPPPLLHVPNAPGDALPLQRANHDQGDDTLHHDLEEEAHPAPPRSRAARGRRSDFCGRCYAPLLLVLLVVLLVRAALRLALLQHAVGEVAVRQATRRLTLPWRRHLASCSLFLPSLAATPTVFDTPAPSGRGCSAAIARVPSHRVGSAVPQRARAS